MHNSLIFLNLSLTSECVKFVVLFSAYYSISLIFSSTKNKVIQMNYCYPAQTLFMFFNLILLGDEGFQEKGDLFRIIRSQTTQRLLLVEGGFLFQLLTG